MPCFNRDKVQADGERAVAARANAEREVITLQKSRDEEAFLQNCAVHCCIDCCGFNALDLSDPQVRHSVTAIGIDAAKRALVSLKFQVRIIGGHSGLVKFWGNFENAHETRRGYEEACAALERVIEELERR